MDLLKCVCLKKCLKQNVCLDKWLNEGLLRKMRKQKMRKNGHVCFAASAKKRSTKIRCYIQCLTASLNPHSKTGTANILQGGGLSKKC